MRLRPVCSITSKAGGRLSRLSLYLQYNFDVCQSRFTESGAMRCPNMMLLSWFWLKNPMLISWGSRSLSDLPVPSGLLGAYVRGVKHSPVNSLSFIHGNFMPLLNLTTSVAMSWKDYIHSSIEKPRRSRKPEFRRTLVAGRMWTRRRHALNRQL